MKKKMLATMLLAVICSGGCGLGEGGYELDVRTFQLEYLTPEAAYQIIDPYVFGDRGGVVSGDDRTRTITVRETPEMLSRIEEVLRRYDMPEPSVKLHFRLIEANGGVTPDDPRLEEIEAALPQGVFRFRNYRLIGEAVMSGIEWSGVSQGVAAAGERYMIESSIGEVREVQDGGSVKLTVGLLSDDHGLIFRTAVNATIGQLLVLGSAQPDPERGALILAVRVELDRS